MLKKILRGKFNKFVRNTYEISSLRTKLDLSFKSNFSYMALQRDGLLAQWDYLLNKNKVCKKVVYTCITGGYDDLPLHIYLNPDYDYVCYTDSPELLHYKNYGAWKIRNLAYNNENSTIVNRWHKLHPHILFKDEYSESIYVDSNIIVIGSLLFNEIEEHSSADILIPKHNLRDCIYNECDAVLERKKCSPDAVEKIKNYLLEQNFPKNYGLNENNIIYRKHLEPKIVKIMDEWWYFIENFCYRDQLSLAYILWKNGIKPSDIQITNVRETKNYIISVHVGRQSYYNYNRGTNCNFLK